MSPTHRIFWHAKQGNRAEEYEDAYAARVEARRFAVADGAAESAFAALWAQLLARHFVEAPDAVSGPLALWLAPAQHAWLAAFEGRDLPYAAEAHFRRGAFATFLGLLFRAESEDCYRWQALAVGDTCLFHTRGGALLRAFPLERSDSFSNLPQLIGSRTIPHEVEQKQSRTAEDRGCLHDRFWLMTDALAQWFLQEHEAGETPWAALEWLFDPATTNEDFAVWLGRLHLSKQLRNDDVTLMVIQLED
jgi:hypothetical protein